MPAKISIESGTGLFRRCRLGRGNVAWRNGGDACVSAGGLGRPSGDGCALFCGESGSAEWHTPCFFVSGPSWASQFGLSHRHDWASQFRGEVATQTKLDIPFATPISFPLGHQSHPKYFVLLSFFLKIKIHLLRGESDAIFFCDLGFLKVM